MNMTDDLPFYLRGKGKLIVNDSDVILFTKDNPELKDFIRPYKFNDRVLDLDIISSFVYWIIGQQISVIAAESITNRLLSLISPLSPENILKHSDEDIRSVGLSRSKTEYIKNVSSFLIDHESDAEIISSHKFDSTHLRAYFMQIRGVGPWTVNMHLIFILGKKDVFAVKDLAVRKGIKILYGLDELPSESVCNKICDWGNYATVGTILSWRVLGE